MTRRSFDVGSMQHSNPIPAATRIGPLIVSSVIASRDPGSTTVPDSIEAQREAWMRQTIRAAEKEGYGRIAVVCGAWHAPALADRSAAKAGAALLKALPKTNVQAT